jgi:hypothetical protein
MPSQHITSFLRRRLAIVDLDWDNVRAVDILAALRSFLPRRAAASSPIARVTVYPSDYGLQRMAEEAAVGPKVRGRAAMGPTVSRWGQPSRRLHAVGSLLSWTKRREARWHGWWHRAAGVACAQGAGEGGARAGRWLARPHARAARDCGSEAT